MGTQGERLAVDITVIPKVSEGGLCVRGVVHRKEVKHGLADSPTTCHCICDCDQLSP